MTMSDFLELLAADVADSSGASGMPGAPDSSDSAAPGITATNRVRTVLFECLFNHLADERVESLFTILGFEHDFDCYTIAGYPARSAARTAKEIEKIVADFGGMCLTAKRPIGNSTAVVALIRPVGAATPEIICNTIAPSFAADRPIALGPQRTGADGAMRTRNSGSLIRPARLSGWTVMSGQLWPLPATVLLVMLLPDYAAVRYASATRPNAMAVISTYASRGSVASQPVDSAARFKR